MRVITAPEELLFSENLSIFLAGSIEMGNAIKWQDEFIEKTSNIKELVIFNPRRVDWDSSWIQSINNPQFYEQVNWELDALDIADKILMYFDPNTKSPISLLELGLYANSGKLYVICPEGFWRKGNIDIICERYEIPVYTSWDEFYKSEFYEAFFTR